MRLQSRDICAGKAPIQGDVLKKQEQLYIDLGVTPLLASPEVSR